MSALRLLITAVAVLVFIASAVWFILDLAAHGGKTLSAGPMIGLAVAAVLAVLTRLPALAEGRRGRPAGRRQDRRRTSRRPDYRVPQAPRQDWRPSSGREVFSDDVDLEIPPEPPPWLKEITAPADRPARRLPHVAGPERPDRLEEMAGEAEEAFTGEDLEPAADYAGEDLKLSDWLEETTGEAEEAPAAAEPEPAAAEPTGVEEPPATGAEEAPAAAEPAATPRTDSEGEAPAAAPILFSAYYPREVRPQDWQPLRAYMLREFAAEAVRADAQAQFGPRTDIRETVREALAPVPADALVTAIPTLPGFEFDPPQASARFRHDWRRFDFDFRAVDAELDASADGRITFLVEGVIVADVPLSVYVSQTAGQAVFQPAAATASPYQAIFCSYSHKDTTIVERVERASRYFNFRYLRDVTTLRSGEEWNPRLLELIEEADIFQLFWSAHAAASEYVRQEYLHAAALRNSGAKGRYFIRPIRWQEPMPAPAPPELAGLHFDLIQELAEEG